MFWSLINIISLIIDPQILSQVCLHKHLLITVILCFMSVNKQQYFISLLCNKNAKISHTCHKEAFGVFNLAVFKMIIKGKMRYFILK